VCIVIDGVNLAVVLLADLTGSPVIAGNHLDLLDAVFPVAIAGPFNGGVDALGSCDSSCTGFRCADGVTDSAGDLVDVLSGGDSVLSFMPV